MYTCVYHQYTVNTDVAGDERVQFPLSVWPPVKEDTLTFGNKEIDNKSKLCTNRQPQWFINFVYMYSTHLMISTCSSF